MTTTKYNLEYYYDSETSSIKIVDTNIITTNKSASFNKIYEETISRITANTITIDWKNGNIQKSTTRSSGLGTTVNLTGIDGSSELETSRYTLILKKGNSDDSHLIFQNDGVTDNYIYWPYGHANSFYSVGDVNQHMIITFTYSTEIYIAVATPWLETDVIFTGGDLFFGIAGL